MGRLTVDLSGQSTKLPESLRNQEPTHVSRYWIIAQILNSQKNNNLKILDVGGKEGLLRSFGFKPTVIDTEQSPEPNFVLGNALNMPFKDKEFDVSVSCDVLEHIKSADREKFISEILRVSKGAIICAPFSNNGMAEAERTINNYYKSLLKGGHRWLQEHIDNGLPSEAQTEVAIKKLGYNFAKARHFSLDIWTKILEVHLLHASFGDSRSIVNAAIRLYQLYYDELCPYDFSDAGYRTFFIISNDEVGLTIPAKSLIAAKKKRFNNDMLEILISALEDEAASYRKSIQKNGRLIKELDEANLKLEQFMAELNDIKSSKSWQLAQKIAKVKRLGK